MLTSLLNEETFKKLKKGQTLEQYCFECNETTTMRFLETLKEQTEYLFYCYKCGTKRYYTTRINNTIKKMRERAKTIYW